MKKPVNKDFLSNLCRQAWFSPPAIALRSWLPRLQKANQYVPRHNKTPRAAATYRDYEQSVAIYNLTHTWHLR